MPKATTMAPTVSRRMQAVQTPMIPVVGEMVAANPGTISLGQGIVHYGPPPEVAEAAASAAAAQTSHRYGLVSGRADLLAAIERKLLHENGVTVTPAHRVVVTAGSNMGFMNAVLAIADAGDEIVVMSPYYFNHEMAIGIAGCKAVVVPATADYQLDVPAIEAAMTDRTRAVVVISPNNPTGAVYNHADVMAVSRLCAARGCYFISDEAYENFTYEGREHKSPAADPDSAGHVISLFSLSKGYGMAGWRVGFMLVPAALEVAIKKIQDTNLICPAMISQAAAIAALARGRAWIEARTAGFAAVRRLVLERLGELGDRIEVPVPHGAFYVFIRLRERADDLALVRRLIEDHKVAVMPGSTFGATDRTCLRIAYGALEPDTVAEGMNRLVGGLERLIP